MTQVKNLAIIVLAAGKGTRMLSSKPKVLHEISGKPLLGFVLDVANELNPDKTVVIAGYKSEEIIERFSDNKIDFVIQKEQLGTAHAVDQAKDILKTFSGDVAVLSGDVPLLKKETLLKLYESHKKSAAVITVATSNVDFPKGYGRIIRNDNNSFVDIREEKDLREGECGIKEINAGIYFFDKTFLFTALSKINNDNSQGEYYLTDIVKLTVENQNQINSFCIPDSQEIMGINTQAQLQKAEKIVKRL